MKVWRIYRLRGHDENGRRIWEEMGVDYANAARAREEIYFWQRLFPHLAHQVRKVEYRPRPVVKPELVADLKAAILAS